MSDYANFSPIPSDEMPLNQRNYSEINAALSRVNRARRMIERARSAGYNCDAQEADCNFNEDRLNKLKSVYFPNRP